MLLCPTNPLNHVNGIGELNVDKKEEINVMFLKRENSGAHDNFPWRMGFTFLKIVHLGRMWNPT
jgi:hypothetical protein